MDGICQLWGGYLSSNHASTLGVGLEEPQPRRFDEQWPVYPITESNIFALKNPWDWKMILPSFWGWEGMWFCSGFCCWVSNGKFSQVACGTSAVGRDMMNLSHCGQLAACWAAKSLVASKLCRRCAFAVSVSDEFVVWRGGGGILSRSASMMKSNWLILDCIVLNFRSSIINKNMFLYKGDLNALICNTQQVSVDVREKCCHHHFLFWGWQ